MESPSLHLRGSLGAGGDLDSLGLYTCHSFGKCFLMGTSIPGVVGDLDMRIQMHDPYTHGIYCRVYDSSHLTSQKPSFFISKMEIERLLTGLL